MMFPFDWADLWDSGLNWISGSLGNLAGYFFFHASTLAERTPRRFAHVALGEAKTLTHAPVG
jgi:hypothetical protein